MHYVIIARDAPGALALRQHNRAAHLRNIALHHAAGLIDDGGALLDGDGNMVGSVMFVNVADRAALDAYLAEEPYATQGVWQNVEIVPMRPVDWAALGPVGVGAQGSGS